MFTVAPSGSTRPAARREQPPFCTLVSIVTGMVASDDALPKAISSAGFIAHRYLNGFTLAKIHSTVVSETVAWISNPASTTTTYSPSDCESSLKPMLPTAQATRKNTPSGSTHRIQRTSAMSASWRPSIAATKGRAFEPTTVIAMPNAMVAVMMLSVLFSTAAAKKLSGTSR